MVLVAREGVAEEQPIILTLRDDLRHTGGVCQGAVLSFLAFNCLFVPPYYSLRVLHADNVLALTVFLAVAVVTHRLVGRSRRSLELATEREREATRLYELTAGLMGVTNTAGIAGVVLQQVYRTCRPDFLELQLRDEPGGEAVGVTLPVGSALPDRKPTASMPVQGTKGLLGEMALWMPGPHLTAASQRLLGAIRRIGGAGARPGPPGAGGESRPGACAKRRA